MFVIAVDPLEIEQFCGGKLGNFIFNQGKSAGKERYFEKSEKIRKVV